MEMQSDRKKRTYIVTIEEQAEEKPTPAQDEDISKEPKSAFGLEEVQKEPCKAEKPKITMIEAIGAMLAVAPIVLSTTTTFFEMAEKMEEKSALQCEITCVFVINLFILFAVLAFVIAVAWEYFKQNKTDR